MWIFLALCIASLFAQDDCDFLFKKIVNRASVVDYQLNWDQAAKRIEDLPYKYPNDIQLSSMGKYDGEELYRIDILGRGTGPKKKVVVIAGVHGNEAVGVSSSLEFIDRIIYQNEFRENFDFVIIPALNPGGLKANHRYLNNQSDLNRTFRNGREESPTRKLTQNLEGENFDLALDLHEAYTREGFFVIKSVKDDRSLSREVLKEIDDSYLITSSTGEYPSGIMGVKNPKVVAYELDGPGESTSSNVGTVKSFFHKKGVRYSYTLESSGQIELKERQAVYVKMMTTYLEKFLELGL